MADLETLLADLTDEGDALEAVVAELESAEWSNPTPAEGWTIAHQVAHLAWTDEMSLLAIDDGAGFNRQLEEAMSDPDAAETFVDDRAAEGAASPAGALLARWRTSRTDLVAALRQVTPGRKIAWFGPEMSAASMATARLMETWAHGQDVVDALGMTREPTARLRNVAHIGVRARNFAYLVNGLEVPQSEFYVELTAPDGALWTWGPEDSTQRVSGPALDFCLLVTRRRHLDDVAVTADGDDATTWLGIAQAFAGPPGEGRAPEGTERLGP